MLEIVSDLHTHTVHSHGKGSVEDNVRAAIEKGLRQIAISDHGFSHMFYAVRDIDAYIGNIAAMKEKYKNDIEVLISAELNLMSLDGELDLPKGYENAFDILTFGYHKMAKYKGFKNIRQFLLPKSHSDKAIEQNTQAYINAIERNNVDVIAHIGYGIPVDKVRIAKHAKDAGVALEINAKHPEFSVEELIECAKTGVTFTISSDAHDPLKVGEFSPAILKAEQAGIFPKQVLNAKK